MPFNHFGKTVAVFLIMGTAIALHSCKYDNASMMPCQSVPDNVSFHSDVLPLFRANCSTSGCHSGASPEANLNLSDSVAYQQLMRPGLGYVDTVNPTYSVIYVSMTNPSKIMPPTGKLDDCKINLILKWIEQKAKNN